jgi:hypothetical protein
MCEVQQIRYVHFMKHPSLPDELEVGCVCAGWMEEDMQAAKSREKNAKRRFAFPDRSGWNKRPNGGRDISLYGNRFMVLPWGGRWRLWMNRRLSVNTYATLREGQLRIFDIAEQFRNGQPSSEMFNPPSPPMPNSTYYR